MPAGRVQNYNILLVVEDYSRSVAFPFSVAWKMANGKWQMANGKWLRALAWTERKRNVFVSVGLGTNRGHVSRR
ncbi:hypothetical protein TIFTF001_001323 [Ficus carica]|uniref:Uncharacterized protein n=1 Tax=Ficus carica TaxID=3494 RepID=A0AA87ZFB3_FICCA|nr:hypothetical protein TIFTF001_001323 [Ficus carica]